jgi:acyl-CoA thioesterase FadM
MENIEIVEIEGFSGTETHVIIDRGNGEFTSMPKSVWDELEAAKEAQSSEGGLDV